MTEKTMTREELARLLKERTYLEGDFTLSSGRKSHYIIDKYLFETDPDLLRAVAKEMAARIPDSVNRIAGVELGGVPLATAVSLETGKPFIIVKKESKGYGTNKAVEGAYEEGESVVVVEDVLTTAGQAIKGVRRLEAIGVRVAKLIGVVNRQEGAAENLEEAGVAWEAIFTRDDLGIEAKG